MLPEQLRTRRHPMPAKSREGPTRKRMQRAMSDRDATITKGLFTVLNYLALEEHDLGRIVRKMNRVIRDHPTEIEQKAKPLFDRLALAILKSFGGEPTAEPGTG